MISPSTPMRAMYFMRLQAPSCLHSESHQCGQWITRAASSLAHFRASRSFSAVDCGGPIWSSWASHASAVYLVNGMSLGILSVGCRYLRCRCKRACEFKERTCPPSPGRTSLPAKHMTRHCRPPRKPWHGISSRLEWTSHRLKSETLKDGPQPKFFDGKFVNLSNLHTVFQA